MKHFVFCCLALTGHLNPMTSLARSVESRGHRVTFLGVPDAGPFVASQGFGFMPVAEDEFPVGAIDEFQTQLAELSGRDGLEFTIDWLKRSAQAVLDDGPERMHHLRADGVVADQSMSAAASIAKRLEIPFVTASITLALHEEPNVPPVFFDANYDPTPAGRKRNAELTRQWGAFNQPILEIYNKVHDAWGLPQLTSHRDNDSQLAQIAQQPAFFDFPRQSLPACFHYTGPFVGDHCRIERHARDEDFPWHKLDGRPLVYASMGTLQNGLVPVFEAIAAATEDLDVQLVVALGRRDAPMLSLPGDPIVVPFAPQLDLIDVADLVITHAGLNTVLESLSAGVPMVAIPVTNDQPGSAARIEHIGAGVKVPLHEADSRRLRAAITTVLDNPRYRERARWCQAQIAETDGLRLATDIIEKAL